MINEIKMLVIKTFILSISVIITFYICINVLASNMGRLIDDIPTGKRFWGNIERQLEIIATGQDGVDDRKIEEISRNIDLISKKWNPVLQKLNGKCGLTP